MLAARWAATISLAEPGAESGAAVMPAAFSASAGLSLLTQPAVERLP